MDIYFCFSQTEFREGKKIEPIWRKQNECVFCFFKKTTEQTFLCDNFEKSLLMEEAIKIDVVTLLAAVDVVTRNLLIAQSRGQVNWMRARAKLLSSTYPSNANCFNINNIGCRLLFFLLLLHWKLPSSFISDGFCFCQFHLPCSIEKVCPCLCVGCHLFSPLFPVIIIILTCTNTQLRWAAAVVAIAAVEGCEWTIRYQVHGLRRGRAGQY